MLPLPRIFISMPQPQIDWLDKKAQELRTTKSMILELLTTAAMEDRTSANLISALNARLLKEGSLRRHSPKRRS